MAALAAWAGRALAAGAALAWLTACSRTGGAGQLGWAQAALERNPDIEVVAVDHHARTVTVKLRDSGVTRVVAAAEVVGAVPQEATGGAAGPVNLVDASGARPMPSGPEAMDVVDSGDTSVEAQASAPATPAASAAQAFSGDTLPPENPPAPGPAPVPLAPHPGQQVVSGPGYSIIVTSKGGKREESATTAQPRVTDAPLEKMHAPIVCDGSRVLNIDNRNLEFAGNAITASHGCEIHITNSRISAGGVGILARGASVHVENSQIIGHRASIEAVDGGQVYVETSSLEGPRRRLDTSAIHDLGGNSWD